MYDLRAKREMHTTLLVTSKTQLTGKSYTNTPSRKMDLNSALGEMSTEWESGVCGYLGS